MRTVLINLLIVTLIYMAESEEVLKFKKLFEWCPGKIEIACEKPEVLLQLLNTGKYIPKNNVPLGIAVHPYEPKMFITVPRWKYGVASTLNWVPVGTGKLNEPLRPYPNWEVNDISSNSSSPYKIISVIRMFVDACGRLWVMDNGIDDKLGDLKQIEPPKLLIFDIKKNVLIRKYIFDSSLKFTKSSFGKIVVDVTKECCEKAFAYITDVKYPALVVYDYQKDTAFRVEHNYLGREPLKSHFYAEGQIRTSDNNLDGICLSGLYKDGYRNLYVSAQSSNKQFITTTKYLQDKSYAKKPDIFHYLGEKCSSCQAGGAQVMDEKTGVMFYSELSNGAISCWNGDHNNFGPATQQNIAVSSELSYVSDMVITEDRELAVISNELRKYFYSRDGVTTRVFVANVDSLIEGTICQPKCALTPCNPKP